MVYVVFFKQKCKYFMPNKCFFNKFYEFFFKFDLKWKKDVADIESYTKLTSFFDFFVTKVSL